jgi:ABC-type siderophore export system fused ATPase/permease subunit
VTDGSSPANYHSDCHRIASRAKRHAISAGVANVLCVTAIIIIVIILPGSHPFLAALLAVASVVCAVATLAISALLLLDAALFTLMATYPDELSGGGAVDDLLARAKLKPLPETTRPLSQRIAGTRRWMRRQSVLALLSILAAALALAANFA